VRARPSVLVNVAAKPEMFAAFKRGWHDGAVLRAQDPKWIDVPDTALMDAYQRGWNVGKDARLCALWDYCERIQHNPRVKTMVALPGGSNEAEGQSDG
jgi:hypothetical protein